MGRVYNAYTKAKTAAVVLAIAPFAIVAGAVVIGLHMLGVFKDEHASTSSSRRNDATPSEGAVPPFCLECGAGINEYHWDWCSSYREPQS